MLPPCFPDIPTGFPAIPCSQFIPEFLSDGPKGGGSKDIEGQPRDGGDGKGSHSLGVPQFPGASHTFFAVGIRPLWEKEVPGSTTGHCWDIHGDLRDFGFVRRSLDRVWTFSVIFEVSWIRASGFGIWDL